MGIEKKIYSEKWWITICLKSFRWKLVSLLDLLERDGENKFPNLKVHFTNLLFAFSIWFYKKNILKSKITEKYSKVVSGFKYFIFNYYSSSILAHIGKWNRIIWDPIFILGSKKKYFFLLWSIRFFSQPYQSKKSFDVSHWYRTR